MLADPKASSLVTSFAMKWLNLDDSRFRAARSEVVPGIQRTTAA